MINLGNNQIAFFIDGTYWPMPQQDFLYCRAQRGLNLAVPILELKFNDRTDFLGTNNIVSGTRLTTSWHTEKGKKIIDWYIEAYDSDGNPEKTTTLIAKLYKPKWVRNHASPRYGTSFEAIMSIAKECNYNFKSNVLDTDDEGLWMGNYTNFGLASSIASRGYAGDSACMLLAAGLDGVIYNNIFEEISFMYKENILTDTPSKSSDIPIYKIYNKKERATSQMLYGYQHEVLYDGIDENYKIDKIPFRKDFSVILPINEEFYGNVGIVRSEQYPLNIGNDSRNRQYAYYANRKRKTQFLDTIMCFSNGFTTLSLLDRAEINYNGNVTKGFISNIITTFNGSNLSVTTRNDVLTTNQNVGE